MDKPYRVGIWCAVSSKAQAADDKISLSAQEQAGRRFAQHLAGHVVACYQVPGHTRDVIFWHDAEETMDAYRDLRADVQAGKLDVLHAMDADRLGRDPALSNQLVSLCEKNGCEVYFASNPHVVGQKSSAQRYIFAITSTRAGEDQLRRIEYHHAGLTARVRRGLHPNHWPYGYRPVRDEHGKVVGGQFHPDEIEAVRTMTQLYLQGHSYQAIADALNDSPHRPRRTKHWSERRAHHMLHNDTYAGFPAWGDVTADRPSDLFPALWDTTTYAALRAERASRVRSKGRRKTSLFLHVAYCDRCGQTMWGSGTGDEIRCSTYIRYHQKRGTQKCHSNYFLHRSIIDALTELFRTEFTGADLAGLATNSEQRAELSGRLSHIAGRIADLEQRRTRLALALAADAMDITIYQAADTELKSQLDAWQREHDDLQSQLDATPDPE